MSTMPTANPYTSKPPYDDDDYFINLPMAQQYPLALKPAEIVLTVTEFKDIFTVVGTPQQRCTGHSMAMPKPHSRVFLRKHNTEVVVRPFGATIQLRLTPEIYFPIGIAFVLKAGKIPTVANRLGLLNFGQLTLLPDKNTLAITDRFFEDGDGKYDDEYEFSVIIQDATTGQIGIIDPMIVHDPR